MRWSEERLARAEALRAAGQGFAEIGAAMGCTAESARTALRDRRLGHTRQDGYFDQMRRNAAPMANAPPWKSAGVTLNPRNFDVAEQAERPTEGAGVRDVMGRVARQIVSVGSAKPGRYRVAHFTDIHHGSKFCDGKAFLDMAAWAVEEGATAVVMTGDILDGQKACLAYEQRCIGADDQATEAVEIWTASAFRKHDVPVVAIGGNHDGYAHSATGIDYGAVLRDRMREARLSWHYLGQCLGRAQVHGAKWELWHPMGAGSTRNAVRRILNARAESYEAHDRPNVLAIGHYHRHCSFMSFPERVFCVSGGTFQRKGSEFANRITGGWDVGAGIVSYTVRDDGSVGEFAAEFRSVDRIAMGWAA